MYIIGLKQSGYNTSACIMKDGKITFAICEERLTRNKKTKNFPINAVKACLEYENITLKDVDFVTVGWNPVHNLEALSTPQVSNARYLPEFFYSVPAYLASLSNDGNLYKEFGTVTEMNLPLFGEEKVQLRYIDHHLTHLASVFFMSPFEESALLCIDAFGENTSTTLAYGKGEKIEVIEKIKFPQSLGVFYQLFTEFLGFQPNSDEWKVMGAAPYGDSNKYYDQIKGLIKTFEEDDKYYEIDLTYNDHYLFSREHLYNQKFLEEFGNPISDEEDLKTRGYDIAASLQKVVEDIVFEVLTKLQKKTNCKNICLTGGLAMNCVLNGKVIENTPFEDIYINYCSDDTGTSIGSALYYYHNVLDKKRDIDNSQEYLGYEYSNEYIEQVLNKFKVKYYKSDDIFDETSDLLIDGNIIGWFQGRSEYGERALGNRSIIADPRSADVKDRINLAVKYREAFRPFAPAILEEHLDEYFINAQPTPYMEKVYTFKEEVRDSIPAVVHEDGTGRLQTVSKNTNEKWHKLISTFYNKTEVPIIVNTSLNIKGDAMVLSPEDAIETFYKSGLDVLVLNDYIIKK